MATSLQVLLDQFREQALAVRDQGTSFEKLMIQYFSTEAFYRSFYDEVLFYADWVTRYGAQAGIERRVDIGIDLVAITKDGRFHAIQCKNYAPDHCIAMGILTTSLQHPVEPVSATVSSSLRLIIGHKCVGCT